jgi:uncharacterized protein YutE (UPF0331/DUF86 family)
MSINQTLVRERLAFIEEQRRELAAMRRLPLSEFRQPRNAAAAESFLRRSLEAVLDVGRHILAKSGRGDLAQEYKSIARGLGTQGVVTDSLAAKLVAMAGYRNRLVHLYYDIGPEELYRILQNELDSFVSFVKEVQAYLDAAGPPHPNVPSRQI